MKKLLFVLLFATQACAQSMDGGTLGRAGVHEFTANSSSVGWNPALLARKRDYFWSLELPSPMAVWGNNAFSVSFWNRNVGGDHAWTQADRDRILNRIPSGGFKATVQGIVPAVGLVFGRFGFSVNTEAYGYASLPKDVVRLALLNNELDRTYNLGSFAGDDEVLLNYALGFGYEFDQENVPGFFVGASFHFYQGLHLDKVLESGGDLRFTDARTDSTIVGSSFTHTISSNSGDGVGFDLSSILKVTDRLDAGLSIRQLGARLSWYNGNNRLITFQTDSLGLRADSLGDRRYIERWTNKFDTTYSGGSVETTLPVLIQLNAVYHYNPHWTFMGETLLRTQSSVQGVAGIELGGAASYLAMPWLPLQGGISVGGPWLIRFGLGSGLRFKHYEMEFGWTWNGGLFNSAHGAGFAISHRLNF